MKLLEKEAWFVPLFVFLGVIDIFLRFFWLERGSWTCNVGIFWGLRVTPELLLGIIILILGGLVMLWHHSRKERERWGIFLLILGGSINALDRLFHGCVLDYFNWPFGLAQFLPNFNLADMMLLLGIFGLGIAYSSKK